MARKSRNSQTPLITNTQNKIYKVAIYLRLSVEDKRDNELHSIGNQQKICMKYINNNDDLVLVREFVDNGFSGINFNRNAFSEMLEAIDRGEIDCIIVKDISRFGRNHLEIGKYIDYVFPEKNVRFISINDNYDTFNKMGGSEELLIRFKNIINENYVNDYSTKIKSTIDSKMKKGEFLPSLTSMPYGYLKDVKNNTYLIDEETKNVIINIFELRSQGKSFNYIAKCLNEYGIPSPGKLRFLKGYTKDKRFENAIWLRSTLRSMLSNQTYIGHRVHGKVQKNSLKDKKVRKNSDEWTIIENAHPPIITQELFDAVQIVNNNEKLKLENHNVCDDVGFECRPLFQNKLYCGDCGSKMLAQKAVLRKNSKAPNYVFYRCSEFVKMDKKICSKHYIQGKKILIILENLLKNNFLISNKIENILKLFESTKTPNKNFDLINIENELFKNEETRLQLGADYINGILDKDEYLYIKKKYLEKFDDLTNQKEIILNTDLQRDEVIYTANTMLDSLLQFNNTKEIDRKIIDVLVDKINIYEDDRIEIVFTFDNLFSDVNQILFKSEFNLTSEVI